MTINHDQSGCPVKPGRTFAATTTTKIGLAVVLGLMGTKAQAQEFVDPIVVEVPAQVGFQLNEANFNQWIFGNRNRNVSAMAQLDALLALNLAEIEHLCRLSESQKQKLALAARGDIKRFNDRVAEARVVFERYRNNQNNMGEIMKETQPLAASLAAGLFSEGSLFAKSVGSILTSEQLVQYRAGLRARSQARYQAKVMLALADLDKTVGFTSDQFRRFTALILAETTAPEKPAGQFESNVVLLKIAQIPAEKVRPLFDDAQWKLLEPALRNARAMERMLRANGVLGPAEPNATHR